MWLGCHRYDEHVTNHSCIPCEPGKTRSAGDDASIPPGDGGDTACSVVVCDQDEYVVNHSHAASLGLANVEFCQPCAPGSTRRPGGDLATLANGTLCAPTICGTEEQAS